MLSVKCCNVAKLTRESVNNENNLLTERVAQVSSFGVKDSSSIDDARK